jgi:hypothetical protein
MTQREVAWLLCVAEDGSEYFIDWRQFKRTYGGLEVKRQGRILREISQCHEEHTLSDGPIVKTRQPSCFSEAKDGTHAG